MSGHENFLAKVFNEDEIKRIEKRKNPYERIAGMYAAKEAVAKASGMFSIIGGIGGLVAPIVLGNIATYVLGGNHPVNQFTIAFVGMLMFGIVVTISGRKMKEKNQ